MFKKIIILIVALLVLLSAGLYVLLSCSVCTERILPFLIEEKIPGIKFSDFSVQTQAIGTNGVWTLSNVKAEFSFQQQEYFLHLKTIKVDFSRLIPEKGRFYIDLNGLALSSSIFQIQDAKFSLPVLIDKRALQIEDGFLHIKKIEFADYISSEIFGRIRSDRAQMVVQDLTGGFYGAKLKGHLMLDYQREFYYSVKVNIEDLDLSKLSQVNPAVSSNVQGIVNGSLTLEGDQQGLKSIQGQLHALRDARVKAALLKILLNYIPQSSQRKELDSLIQQNGTIPLDTALVDFDTENEKLLSTKYNLKSKKFNLDMNLQLDLNIEGGLNNLLKFQETFLKKKGD